MKTLIPEAKLDFWINSKANVLLEGKHGIGKTHVVLEAFKRHKLTYAYFSCATLDPWVDFVGIPKVVNVNGVDVLKVIPPEIFAFDSVDVIFLDELNRAPSKVRNALMELLQFKSINGKKLKRLKMVWGAINPPPDKDSNIVYDVEELDYAQVSRFHVRYEIPFEIAEDYFTKKYGAEQTENIVNWWMKQPLKIRDEFPPRNIDYALSMIKKGGDVKDCLPKCVDKRAFLAALNVRSNLNITGNNGGTGVQARNDFVSITQPELKRMHRKERNKFIVSIANITSEEFINMFRRVGVRTSSAGGGNRLLVSALGKHIINAASTEQLEALKRLRTFGPSGSDSSPVKGYIKSLSEDTSRQLKATSNLITAMKALNITPAPKKAPNGAPINNPNAVRDEAIERMIGKGISASDLESVKRRLLEMSVASPDEDEMEDDYDDEPKKSRIKSAKKPRQVYDDDDEAIEDDEEDFEF